MNFLEEHPTHVGPYEVVRVLGSGGVGTVYLVNQTEPIRRQAALKLIRIQMHSLEILKRFEREHQVLAMLNHPNIAKVFDVGKTETKRPYIVMEYVDGEPITDYCDHHQLDIAARIRLFVQVCHAVQYAHQKGVLHRDIKPSNILVRNEDGHHMPVLIDFGLAKAVSGDQDQQSMLTQLGQPLGTPQYMSPEQIELPPEEIDSRTDVYSLGVVLYELLIGVPPHERKYSPYKPMEFVQSMLDEASTTRPSTRLGMLEEEVAAIVRARGTSARALIRRLRGDLDWIVIMALERDRSRRYATASELANDIGRWLNKLPIVARPPSAAYRMECFVRRHRISVIVSLALVVATILGSAASTFWYMRAGSSWKEIDLNIRRFESVRSEIADTHLWFEEVIANDESLEMERDVNRPLQRTLDLVEQSLATEQATPGSGVFSTEIVDGPLRELRDQLLVFQRITLQRWETKDGEGAIGGVLDQRYDAVYLRIRSLAGDLVARLEVAAAENWKRSAQVSIIVNICSLALIVLALIVAGRILSRKNSL